MYLYILLHVTNCSVAKLDEKSSLELHLGEMENELALARKVTAENETRIAFLEDDKVKFLFITVICCKNIFLKQIHIYPCL